MPKDIRIHAANFNVLDPWQKKLYDYVKDNHTNVSAYLKSLIQRDMEGSTPAPSRESTSTQETDFDAEGFI